MCPCRSERCLSRLHNVPMRLAVAPDVSRMTWRGMLADYERAQRAAGRSPGTIRLHRYRILDVAAIVPAPALVTADQLVRLLSVEHWRPETRKSVRGSFRSFFRWAHESGRLEEDPSARLPGVRIPPAVARPTPEHVLHGAIANADARMLLMLMLAAYAGLRAGEIARLHRSWWDGAALTVTGKGGRTRYVPVVHPALRQLLEELDGWAFPNGYGTHVSPGHVSRIMSRALPDGWTAHTLRHRMATAAYAGTRDLLAVGALLGHSRPETTQRYVRMPDDALRAAVLAAAA